MTLGIGRLSLRLAPDTFWEIVEPLVPEFDPRPHRLFTMWGKAAAFNRLHRAVLDRLRELAESSPSIVTPLNSAIGYEEAAAVAKEALIERKTIRQTVIDRGLVGDKLSVDELDRRLEVLAMTKVADEAR